MLFALQFLTPAFYYIPKASLAAVIIYSVIFMVDYAIVPQLWRISSEYSFQKIQIEMINTLHVALDFKVYP